MHGDQDAEVRALISRLGEVGFRREHRKLLDCFTQIIPKGIRRRSCDQWFCARCRYRRRARLLNKHQGTLRRHHEAQDSAWFITLTRPARDTVGEQLEAVHLFFQHLKRKAQWRGSKRIPAWSQILSAFLAFELGPGTGRPGLIHAHLLVLGPPSEAKEASHWMVAAWLSHFPEASPEAQDCHLLLSLATWLDRFGYLTKGNALDPSWREEDFMEVLMCLGGFPRPFRSLGGARARIQKSSILDDEETQIA